MMLPRARQVEMRVVPWVLFCLASGSIGLYAFISRLLFSNPSVRQDDVHGRVTMKKVWDDFFELYTER